MSLVLPFQVGAPGPTLAQEADRHTCAWHLLPYRYWGWPWGQLCGLVASMAGLGGKTSVGVWGQARGPGIWEHSCLVTRDLHRSGSWPGWPGLALSSRTGVPAQACGGVFVTESKVAGPPGHLLAVRPHPGGPAGLRSTLLGCCGSTSLGHRFVVGAQDSDKQPNEQKGELSPFL